MIPVVLAVLAVAAPLRAEYGVPRLRIASLDGELRVTVRDSLTYALRGPVSSDELGFWPGTVIEVLSGEASFESDLHARIEAPAGALFRISVAEPDGRRGLRVTSLPGGMPVSVELGGRGFAVWRGGSLAVYDGGRVEVDNPEVYRLPGSLPGSGDSLAAALEETGISLTPGDAYALELPAERGFPEPVAFARRRGPAAPLLAAALPDAGLRDALASSPSVPRLPDGGPRTSERDRSGGRGPSGLGPVGGAAVLALALVWAAVAGRNLL